MVSVSLLVTTSALTSSALCGLEPNLRESSSILIHSIIDMGRGSERLNIKGKIYIDLPAKVVDRRLDIVVHKKKVRMTLKSGQEYLLYYAKPI